MSGPIMLQYYRWHTSKEVFYGSHLTLLANRRSSPLLYIWWSSGPHLDLRSRSSASFYILPTNSQNHPFGRCSVHKNDIKYFFNNGSRMNWLPFSTKYDFLTEYNWFVAFVFSLRCSDKDNKVTIKHNLWQRKLKATVWRIIHIFQIRESCFFLTLQIQNDNNAAFVWEIKMSSSSSDCKKKTQL